MLQQHFSKVQLILETFSKNVPCLLSKRSFKDATFSQSFSSCKECTSRAVCSWCNLYSSRHYCSHSKVYTKTGDKGTSSLYTGERRLKSDLHFNALGNVDELSSFIGLAKEYGLERKHNYTEQLERIQCILQDIGTLIATPKPSQTLEDPEREKRREAKFSFNPRHIEELEHWIDTHTETLPSLSNFILPGGGRVSAALHVCRSVCRRAERSVVPLVNEETLDPQVMVYINRLSDYLFTVARKATILDNKKETIYIRPKSSKSKE